MQNSRSDKKLSGGASIPFSRNPSNSRAAVIHAVSPCRIAYCPFSSKAVSTTSGPALTGGAATLFSCVTVQIARPGSIPNRMFRTSGFGAEAMTMSPRRTCPDARHSEAEERARIAKEVIGQPKISGRRTGFVADLRLKVQMRHRRTARIAHQTHFGCIPHALTRCHKK